MPVRGGGGYCWWAGGNSLLDLVANLFCAETGRAIRIQRNVGVQVLEECRIVALLEMDVGQQPVDDGDTGSEKAGLIGGDESFGEMFFVEEKAAKRVLTQPRIRIEFESRADELLRIGKIGTIEKEAAETNIGVGVMCRRWIRWTCERRLRHRRAGEG